MKPFIQALPLFPILYAETHYTLKGFSLIFRRWPEIVCDAPHRVEPGKPIPLLILIRDADRFPVRLRGVRARIAYSDGNVDERTLSDEPADVATRSWHRIHHLDPRREFSGKVSIDVSIEAVRSGKGKVRVVHTHNVPGRKTRPLVVFVAKDPLPSFEGCLFADLHHHSEYTSDQVEYGAPLDAVSAMAPAMGISAVAVTDHSYDLDDSEASYKIKDPGLERWNGMRRRCDDIEKRTGFVLIPGEELSCGSAKGKNIHLLLLNNKTFVPGTGDSAEVWLKTRPDHSVREVLDRKEEHVLAYAAHPENRFHFLQRRLLARDRWEWEDYRHPNLNGLEILNGPADKDFLQGLRRWIQLLLEGRRVFLIAGNDAHGAFNGTVRIGLPFLYIKEDKRYVFGRSRTGILVESEPNRQNVLEALAKGRSFITTGPAMKIEIRNETGKTAGIGESICGKRFELTVESATSDEFGAFDHGRLWLGDLSAKRETPWIEFKVPVSDNRYVKTFEIEDLTTDVYIRGIVVTRKETKTFFCLTNPIWVSRAT
jgi:hypothetical protein